MYKGYKNKRPCMSCTGYVPKRYRVQTCPKCRRFAQLVYCRSYYQRTKASRYQKRREAWRRYYMSVKARRRDQGTR